LANSGINWIDVIFDWCVNFLYQVAGLLGISYEEINIWLFVIIGPISLLISIFLNYYFYKKIKNLKFLRKIYIISNKYFYKGEILSNIFVLPVLLNETTL